MSEFHTGDSNSAGADFDIPALDPAGPNSDPLEFVFGVTDSRLNISIDVFDDDLLEANETFILILSIPQNPAVGQLSGMFTQSTVHIFDNEGNFELHDL